MWFHTKKSKEKLKKPKLPILLTHPTFGDQNRVQNFFFTFLKKNFFSESWVCKDFLGVYHEKFSHWKFSGTERFTKKFCFSLTAPKKKYRARVPTILMPLTFPIASMNHYTPNFCRGGLKVDLVWLVCPPAPSKVSLSEKLSIILGAFRCFFLTK